MDPMFIPSPICTGLTPPATLPDCPGGRLAPWSCWANASSNVTRLALYPVVFTFAMLLLITSIWIWWFRSPETPAKSDRIMICGLLWWWTAWCDGLRREDLGHVRERDLEGAGEHHGPGGPVAHAVDAHAGEGTDLDGLALLVRHAELVVVRAGGEAFGRRRQRDLLAAGTDRADLPRPDAVAVGVGEREDRPAPTLSHDHRDGLR